MYNLHELQGKTIGVVYIFEGETAPGFKHYHVWQSDIISKWLIAIQDLKCRPLILDVRTFVEKSIAGTLPKVDFVINLNCGSYELSPMALVPSICSFLHIPCIPCDAVAILSGENKLLSNLIARATGINVPTTLPYDTPNGIFRPLNLGSSMGVKRAPTLGVKGIYQEFIRGYDITTPIVFNPVNEQFDFMPTVIYIAKEDSVDWFLGEEHKDTRTGFKRETILNLSADLKQKYLELVTNLSINTFCRIDARINCESKDELDELLSKPLKLSSVYFVEINPMPTVWINNAFSHSFDSLPQEHSLSLYIRELEKIVPKGTVHNFLLSLSMIANIKAK